ncbi:MFS transporter [Hortaea werneckii]|nr:MFS transporter [Hortaea werneckii]
MATRHAHFGTEEPSEVNNQSDLERMNEKLEEHEDSSDKSDNNGETPIPAAARKKSGAGNDAPADNKLETLGTNDKYEITEDDCYEELGYCFPKWKKWYILTVIFIVQVSMNFNTSLYSNAIGGLSEEFGITLQGARAGAAVFLITYAFGCELWAPWSEEFGRWPILQLSLFLVNVWQLPVALAPNIGSVMVGRALGGLSTAGGSVTLGMIADLWESDKQQYAVAFVVFSSVGGSILGPIVGGFTEKFLVWQWSIWVQLIFGGAIQLLHFFTVPETRTTILMNRIAKRRRKEGNPNIWGPDELVPFKDRFSEGGPHHLDPSVQDVPDGTHRAGLSFSIVYGQWGFGPIFIGLAFIPIGIGYFIAWASFIPVFWRNKKDRETRPDDERAQYESRLWWLLYTAPCLPIGLIGFAWTIQGPPIHWIGSMIFAAIVGIANYAIYMATIDYMICAYGPYSASATGGNGWARDFLAGVLTVPATPFFENIGAESGRNLEYACTILFCISFVLVIAVYVIYWKGPVLRKRSPFAQQLADARQEDGGRRTSYISTGSDRRGSVNRKTSAGGERPGMAQRNYSQSHRFFGENRVTPRQTPRGTPSASRRGTPAASRSNSITDDSRAARK